MDPKEKKETILLEYPKIIKSDTLGGLIYVISPEVILPMDTNADLEKLKDIQIVMQSDCQKLFIDNKATKSVRKERLQDFLRGCEEYFLTNFGSTLLLIGMAIRVVEFSNGKIPKT